MWIRKDVLFVKEVDMSIDWNKEDLEDLVSRIKDYKDFLSSKDFTEEGKKSVLDEMFATVLMLSDEIKKLQREVSELQTKLHHSDI